MASDHYNDRKRKRFLEQTFQVISKSFRSILEEESNDGEDIEYLSCIDDAEKESIINRVIGKRREKVIEFYHHLPRTTKFALGSSFGMTVTPIVVAIPKSRQILKWIGLTYFFSGICVYTLLVSDQIDRTKYGIYYASNRFQNKNKFWDTYFNSQMKPLVQSKPETKESTWIQNISKWADKSQYKIKKQIVSWTKPIEIMDLIGDVIEIEPQTCIGFAFGSIIGHVI